MVRLLDAAARRYTYAASLSWGGDICTGELEAEVSFTVSWGSAPLLGGPPEQCHDGWADAVEDIRVETINGKPAAEYGALDYLPGETVRQIIDKLEMDHEEEMIQAASDQAGALEPDF